MEIKDLITDIELQECLELVEDTAVNKAAVANHDGEDKETDLVLPEDKEITCKDCGKTFTFTVEEQQFYKERHLSEPKRCKECAKARRKFFRRKGDK